MTIKRVDFHMRDDEGRVLALVDPAQIAELSLGGVVVVEDYEGNQVKAMVEELIEGKNVVALRLDLPTYQASAKAEWIAGAINY